MSNLAWYCMVINDINLPGNYYFHHPTKRAGQMIEQLDFSEPTQENWFDHIVGLTLEERMRKRWNKINKKEAYYQLQYFEHQNNLKDRKLSLALSKLEKSDPILHKELRNKMAEMDRMDPPPKQTGMEYLLRNKWTATPNMQSMVKEMSRRKEANLLGPEAVRSRAEGILSPAGADNDAQIEIDADGNTAALPADADSGRVKEVVHAHSRTQRANNQFAGPQSFYSGEGRPNEINFGE